MCTTYRLLQHILPLNRLTYNFLLFFLTGVDHISFLQKLRQQQLNNTRADQAQNIYIPTHHSKQQPQIKLNVSRATRVLEPPSPSPEVILIDSDDDDDQNVKISFPEVVKSNHKKNHPLQLTNGNKSYTVTQPTSPAPKYAPFADRMFHMSKKVVSEEEDPGFGCGQLKQNVKEWEDEVVDPTSHPQVIDSGQLGIQMRTGGIDDLNEILELMKEIGEIVPNVKERKKSYKEG